MNKRYSLTALGFLLATSAFSANALTIDFVPNQYYTSEVTAELVDFNSSFPANYTGGTLFNASVSDITVKPEGAEGNFWSINDSSTGQFSYSEGVSYYGFLWGSADSYNQISFYNGSQLIGSLNGSQLSSAKNGNDNASFYVNAYVGTGEIITSVSFYSGKNALETDNHAYIPAVSAVPEPETYGMMLAGLGLMGILTRRRKG